MQTEDGSIIHKCLNGEPAAFGILVDKYKAGIYAFVYDKLRNFHDAQDVTQEVFERAYRNLRSLRRWESFAFWLYRIASNQCKRWFQIRSRCPDSQFIEDQCQSVLEKPSLDAYRDSQKDEFLQEALDSLSEIYREVLILHYFGGMTIKDMAKAIGASPTAVEKRLSRARAQLREEMIAMMDTAFEGQRLQASFTFRVVEAIKRMKIHPVSQPRGLPWGISFATGLLATILSLSPYINMSFINPADIPTSLPLPAESKELKVGEIPVDVVKTSDIPVVSNLMGKGKGGEPENMQNAFFMAPQGEGGSWVKKADMPTARNMFSTSAVDEKIYAIGGRWSLPIVEEYDPEADTWARKSNMPTGRQALSTIAVDGIIYAIGGYSGNSRLSTVEAYNPETETWKKMKDMPTPRQLLSTSVVNGKIYAIGGHRNADKNGILSTVEEYDPVKDTWTKKDDMPTARWALSTSVVNGEIYAVGGSIDGAVGLVRGISTVEVYNPATDKWMKKADMPEARQFHSACVVNNRIYIIGGCTDWGDVVESFPTVYEYDPKTDIWTKKADMPTARWWLSASEVGERIYAIGGSTVNHNMVLSTVEEYTPESWQSVIPQGKLPTKWGKTKSY